MAKGRQLHHAKKALALVLAPAVLLIVALLALDPVVEWQTRRRLELFEGYTVSFADASLHLPSLDYRLSHLRILKLSAGGAAQPFLYVDTLGMKVRWSELWKGHLVAAVDVQSPQINVITAKLDKDQQTRINIPNFVDKLEASLPLTVDRVQLRHAEIKLIDKTKPEQPQLGLYDVEATFENLSRRAAMARGEPTTMAVLGTLEKSAALSAFVTADPLADGLYFSGRVTLTGLELNQLSEIIAAESGLRFTRGTLEVFAEFDCRKGTLSGALKSVMANAEVEAGKSGLGYALKGVVADAVVNLLADRVDGHNVLVRVTPISGQIEDAGGQLGPVIADIVRKAFMTGVEDSFALLPPRPAASEERAMARVLEASSPAKERNPPTPLAATRTEP